MMGLGIDGVIAAAGMVSAWPGAVSLLPAMPVWGLIAIVFGGLWLCLWMGPWRRWGGLAIVAGLSSLLLVRSPDVLIDGAGRLLAVRSADGRLTLSSTRAAKFVRASWLRRGGQDATPAEDWPQGETSRDGRLICDGLGCFYRAKGRIVALAMRADAQAEDCWSADVVVATVPLGRSCKQQTLVVDRFDLARDGAHAIYLDADAVRIESANGLRGDRPWVLKRRKRFTPNNRR
jgi:competence protein ComEC